MTDNTFEFKGIRYRREPASRGTADKFGCKHPITSLGPIQAPPSIHTPADPVEIIVYRGLIAAQVPFTNNPRDTLGLDFKLLTEPEIYIECKQFHSPRITEQMSRAKDVIAVQGIEAAHFFAGLLK